MPNDIKQLKQDFLCYINFLVFPSPEILVGKISPIFQKNALNKIEIKHNNEKILFIGHKNKIKYECHLTKSDLGKFGLSLEGFRKDIEDIKHKTSKKIFSQAIKEVIILHNKKLCEIYVPSVILAYTELYEKFKQANSKEKTTEEIFDLIYESLKDEISEESCYSYLSFDMAYQHPHLNTNDLVETLPFNQEFVSASNTKDTCLNILNTVKAIQLNPYREAFINLIDSIEKLNFLQVKDKNANNDLIAELKNLTKSCFLKLFQTTFYEQTEKFTCEKKIIEKFRDDCNQFIKEYQEEHFDEFKKQSGILNKILWLIGKLIPSAIIPKEKRMTFFGGKATNNTQRFTEINIQLDQLEKPNYLR